MQCPRCQTPTREGVKFCESCGARVAASCPGCGVDVRPGAKFCGACGARLEAAPTSPSPRAYTPPYLAEKILTSRSAVEGERKQVTVLFADVKGSLELLAPLDPEEARRLLDAVAERMIDAVHRYEGTVNNVMGDGIMALFGAPLAQEDHAVRACYAALRMQETMKQYAEQLQQTGGPPVQVRVGLNSGEVVVGAIESDLRMDYTAVGPTTHLAARMEQMATPGSIWITADTHRLAEGYVEVEPLGLVSVKGLAQPVEAYQLIGAGHARARLQVAAVRGLTRFVGRDGEMEVLRRALERAQAGRGQIVAAAGEPGVGKSRLFWEFLHSTETRSWLAVESGSDLHGKGHAYFSAIELLKGYFEIEARDDEWKIHDKVTSKVLSLDMALEPILPALLALLDVPIEDPAWQALTPPQRRQRTQEACRRLLLRQSQAAPLVLVVENLHWLDSETQSLLDSLVESLPTAQMLLLVNYRPEYRHSWGSKTYYTQLRLDPLAPENAEALLHTLVGPDITLAPLKQLLFDVTEGNPFFLEESVRTLVETKALTGQRGSYQLATALQSIHVPASIHAIIAGRIDRLAPEDKHLLQSASVIGRDVPFALLQAIAGLPDDALRARLARLQAAEFLYEARLFPDLEYVFKHALTHGVAYASLLRERRRALHAAIADAIEKLYPDRLAQHIDRLAHHALLGEAWDKALSYLRQTGIRAMGRSANREAVGCFDQALVALGHLPESQETRQQAIDLRFDLRSALQPLGEFGPALDHLRAAEALAEELGDQVRLGRALAYKANHFWWMGEHERAVESGQRALTLADAAHDLPLKVLTHFFLGQAYNSMGDYRAAVEFTGRNVASLQGDLQYQRFGLAGLPSVLSRSHLVRAQAELGEFEEGLAQAEEALRIAETAGHPYDLIVACIAVNDVWLRRGDVPRAIPPLERALALRHSANLPVWFPTIASNLGLAYALAGRVAEAVPLLEQAVEQAVAMRIMYNHAFRLAGLGEAYLLAGRTDSAAEVAGRALTLARQHRERGHEAWVLRLLGEIASHRDPIDAAAAEEHYRQALALAESLGMRPLLARCRVGLGALYRAEGRVERARAELTIARDLLRSLSMTAWLLRAETELASVDG